MRKRCEGVFRGFVDKEGKEYPPDKLPERVKKNAAHAFIQEYIKKQQQAG